MKRDWDLLRKQLIDVEEENDVLADMPSEPKWQDQPWEEFDKQYKEYQIAQGRIAGHLEMLIESGYVEGIHVLRGADQHISFGISNPRLTMSGHDLLDTMRSSTIWDSIKSAAKNKGIELTFDAVKMLAGAALKHVIGST